MAVTVPAGTPTGTTAQAELLPGRAVRATDFVRLKLRMLRNGFRGQTWRIVLNAHGVRAICDFPDAGLAFDREAFGSDPRIAAIVWDR